MFFAYFDIQYDRYYYDYQCGDWTDNDYNWCWIDRLKWCLWILGRYIEIGIVIQRMVCILDCIVLLMIMNLLISLVLSRLRIVLTLRTIWTLWIILIYCRGIFRTLISRTILGSLLSILINKDCCICNRDVSLTVISIILQWCILRDWNVLILICVVYVGILISLVFCCLLIILTVKIVKLIEFTITKLTLNLVTRKTIILLNWNT